MMHPRSGRCRLVLAAALLSVAGACNGGDRDVILVSAAASLSDAFTEVETAFEELHPGIDVVVNLGGSSALREQILSGAPVDVFAPANRDAMDDVVAAGLAADAPPVYALNVLQIAVPSGNPGGVTGLADFANEALAVGLCAAAVPCGELAREALTEAGVVAAPDTNEPDVRALLTKVAAGELDAGIVYVTDVLAAGDEVEGIEIPSGLNAVTEYPIAALAGTADAELAASFVAFVLSEEGRTILRRHGFLSS